MFTALWNKVQVNGKLMKMWLDTNNTQKRENVPQNKFGLFNPYASLDKHDDVVISQRRQRGKKHTVGPSTERKQPSYESR